jgi:hypothetical protein
VNVRAERFGVDVGERPVWRNLRGLALSHDGLLLLTIQVVNEYATKRPFGGTFQPP